MYSVTLLDYREVGYDATRDLHHGVQEEVQIRVSCQRRRGEKHAQVHPVIGDPE